MKSMVVRRKLLMGNLIVTVNLKRKKLDTVTLPDKRSYEFFSRWVNGGQICFHIFEFKKCEKHGKNSIIVEAQVWEKEYSNGAIRSYVDLYPTAEKCTHSVRKCPGYSDLTRVTRIEELVFKFGKGALVFTPLKEN